MFVKLGWGEKSWKGEKKTKISKQKLAKNKSSTKSNQITRKNRLTVAKVPIHLPFSEKRQKSRIVKNVAELQRVASVEIHFGEKTCSCHCNLTIATVFGRTIMKLETSPTQNVRECESENQQTMIICMSGVHETLKQSSNQSWTERKFNSKGKRKPHGMS